MSALFMKSGRLIERAKINMLKSILRGAFIGLLSALGVALFFLLTVGSAVLLQQIFGEPLAPLLWFMWLFVLTGSVVGAISHDRDNE